MLLPEAKPLTAQMGLNDSEACELLTDGVDVATDAIFAAEVYGKRHYHDHMVAAPAAADSQAKRLNETVLDKIPYVYAAVLEFTYNARKFMKHGKTGKRPAGGTGARELENKENRFKAEMFNYFFPLLFFFFF